MRYHEVTNTMEEEKKEEDHTNVFFLFNFGELKFKCGKMLHFDYVNKL